MEFCTLALLSCAKVRSVMSRAARQVSSNWGTARFTASTDVKGCHIQLASTLVLSTRSQVSGSVVYSSRMKLWNCEFVDFRTERPEIEEVRLIVLVSEVMSLLPLFPSETVAETLRVSVPSRRKEWGCGFPSNVIRAQRRVTMSTCAVWMCGYVAVKWEPRMEAKSSGGVTGYSLAMM